MFNKKKIERLEDRLADVDSDLNLFNKRINLALDKCEELKKLEKEISLIHEIISRVHSAIGYYCPIGSDLPVSAKIEYILDYLGVVEKREPEKIMLVKKEPKNAK